jgi:hypothetical protein
VFICSHLFVYGLVSYQLMFLQQTVIHLLPCGAIIRGSCMDYVTKEWVGGGIRRCCLCVLFTSPGQTLRNGY